MDACAIPPEPYISTIKLAPTWNEVLQKLPFHRASLPSYSIGVARKSILENVQLELTKVPDATRMDPEPLQKLTELIVAHHTSLNAATVTTLFLRKLRFQSPTHRLYFLFFCLESIFNCF